ncbi:MAG: YicC/YloC family endoribonuclease [Candidatus Brocadiia bacterium]
MAIRSMTGYGQARFELAGVPYVIELRAVNNRYLKITFKLPSALSAAQEPVRKKLTESVGRGSVDVFIRSLEGNGELYSINPAQIERYHETMAREYPNRPIPIEKLILLPGVATKSETAFDEELLGKMDGPLSEAIDKFNVYREGEGDVLAKDMLARLAELNRAIAEIEARAALVPEEYKRKLTERVNALLAKAGEVRLDEATLSRELALYADRIDISEEIVRFRHHAERFVRLIEAGGSIGREGDFIVQEMNREANTIGAKCSDISITDRIITVKTELEKIREQVQNIE